jgi:LPS export ABC transporter protein LptC
MLTGQSKYTFQIAALLMGCFFIVASCENDPEDVKNAFEKKAGIEEALKIESYLSQDGYVKAKLTAPYMLRYLPDARSSRDSSYLEFPRTLHVDFFDSSGNKESYLDARYGKYYETERKVLLRDSVLVINMKNGDTLRTQKLWWDQNKSEFSTDDTAYIFQPDKVILAANGLQAAQNLTNIKFFNSSGVLSVPKSDSTAGVPNDSLSAGKPDTVKVAPTPNPLKRPDTLRSPVPSLIPRGRKDSGNRKPGIFRGRQ